MPTHSEVTNWSPLQVIAMEKEHPLLQLTDARFLGDWQKLRAPCERLRIYISGLLHITLDIDYIRIIIELLNYCGMKGNATNDQKITYIGDTEKWDHVIIGVTRKLFPHYNQTTCIVLISDVSLGIRRQAVKILGRLGQERRKAPIMLMVWLLIVAVRSSRLSDIGLGSHGLLRLLLLYNAGHLPWAEPSKNAWGNQNIF